MDRQASPGEASAGSAVGGPQSPGDDAGFRYRAFVSYSHADKRWGRWVARTLESWRAPRRLVGRRTSAGPIPARLTPVFRDRDELPAAAELGEHILAALEASAALIVVCSPAAARSRWVNEEILSYKRLGRADRIFAFVVAGDPSDGDGPLQCFPPALRFRVDDQGQLTDEPVEPAAADARPEGDGRARARLRLLAGLLGIGYDELARREQRRRQQRLLGITAASVAGMALAGTLAVVATLAQQDAERRREQAESLIGFMVGDLRDKLEPIGRLDLLREVGEEAMAYFDSLPARDMNDAVLARQVRALTQLGEVRLGVGDPDGALTAFREALTRSTELARRHPDDGGRLFDRGQAEFWVGYVHWERGELDAAREWLTRYRDTSVALSALDPDNDDWVIEVAYGEHNLGVLAFSAGRYEEAETAFREDARTRQGLLERRPDDRTLRSDLADTLSWLGSALQFQGRLREASAYFEEASRRFSALADELTDDRPLVARGATELSQFALVNHQLGDYDVAADLYREGVRVMQALVEFDPENVEWREALARNQLSLAESLAAGGDPAAAQRHFAAGKALAVALWRNDPTNAATADSVVRAYVLEAALAYEAGQVAAARPALESALEALAAAPLPNRPVVRAGLMAEARLWRGRLAQSPDAAEAEWGSGLAVLEASAPDGIDPFTAAPRIALLEALGRCAAAAALAARIPDLAVPATSGRCPLDRPGRSAGMD